MCGSSSIPKVPGFTPEETMSQQKQLDLLNQQEAISKQQGTILKQQETLAGQGQNVSQVISRLFNPDGTINQQALQDFSGQLQARQGLEGQIAQRGLGFLAGGPLDPVAQAEQDLYLRALAGTEPTTEGLKAQKKREFEQFKQAAGQRGIRITGDTPETASSSSTAGIRLLSEFNQRFNLASETERQNLRGFLGGQTLGREGQQFNQALQLTGFNPLQQQLGAFDAATRGFIPILGGISQGLGGISQGLGGISQGYGAYAQSFAQQRNLQFNRDVQEAQRENEEKGGIYSGIGGILGTGVGGVIGGYFGGPAGAIGGAGIGSQVGTQLGKFAGPQSGGQQGGGFYYPYVPSYGQQSYGSGPAPSYGSQLYYGASPTYQNPFASYYAPSGPRSF
jgi:hypothetical protein